MDTVTEVISYAEFQFERVVARLQSRMLEIANMAKDRICAADYWWFLDTERTQVTTANTYEYNPPARFRGLGRRVWYVDSNNQIVEFEIKTHNEVRLLYPTDETGVPKYLYYNYETEKLVFAPIPDDAYPIHYDAIIKLRDLSNDESNILTRDFPHILVAAILAEMHFAMSDMQQYGICEGLFRARLKDLTTADMRIKAERARTHLTLRTGQRGNTGLTHRQRRIG